MNQFVLSFDDIDRHDIARVGGKGANLGELTRAGFPVPPGFCVTTEAYRLFAKPVAQDVLSTLDGLDATDLTKLRAAGEKVRGMLSACEMPHAVSEAILVKWRGRAPDTAYAVRSSATAEDLPTASFAGQQDTYLNIRGQEELLDAIRDCFVSLFTDRAILYRIQNGFPHEAVAVSVVVQDMVLPDVSGILFTADPITGNRDILTIDASFGLGEALVSGLVTADLFKVDKITDRVVVREIAEKTVAIRPLPEGGTERVEVPADARRVPSLADPQIEALAEFGHRIEAHYGAPQDVEWALVGKDIFITQSRPITSLYPLPTRRPGDRETRAFLSLSHLQVMTDAMPPMAISVWRHIPPVGLDEQGQFAFIQDIGGRFYADITPVLLHPITCRVLVAILGVADPLTKGSVEELASRPVFRHGPGRIRLGHYLWQVKRDMAKLPATLLFGPPKDILATVNAILSGIQGRDEAPGANPGARLDTALRDLKDVVPVAGAWLPRLAAGIMSQRLLRRLLPHAQRYLDDFERGIEGNIVTEMNLALGDLGDMVAVDPHARAELEAATGASAVDLSPEIRNALDRFLARYGHRAMSEIDISKPRWADDPKPLYQMILGMALRTERGAHRAHFAELVAASKAAEAKLPAQAPWLLRPIVRRLVSNARILMPLREHHKYLMILALSHVRRALLEVAAGFVDQGILDEPDDVWFLLLPEVAALLAGERTDARSLVATRRAIFKRNAALTPPRIMTDRGEIPQPKFEHADAPPGALVGSPVSAGIYEGRVHVITDPATEVLSPGEVLVAPFTDPGWTPLFVNAAAVVTEVGGLMTHGSVVAREYGIPAVIGVIDATKRLKTGDRVRVDGSRGMVEILEDEAE